MKVFVVTCTDRSSACYGQHFCGVYATAAEAAARVEPIKDDDYYVAEWDLEAREFKFIATNVN